MCVCVQVGRTHTHTHPHTNSWDTRHPTPPQGMSKRLRSDDTPMAALDHVVTLAFEGKRMLISRAELVNMAKNNQSDVFAQLLTDKVGAEADDLRTAKVNSNVFKDLISYQAMLDIRKLIRGDKVTVTDEMESANDICGGFKAVYARKQFSNVVRFECKDGAYETTRHRVRFVCKHVSAFPYWLMPDRNIEDKANAAELVMTGELDESIFRNARISDVRKLFCTPKSKSESPSWERIVCGVSIPAPVVAA